jgi:hypothetical protein
VGGSVYTFEEDTYETRVFLKRLAPLGPPASPPAS